MGQIKTTTWEANRGALLKTFERSVKPGGFFEKMPYPIWRELSKSENPKMIIARRRQTDLEAPYDLLSFVVDGTYTFIANDNSFGLFLDFYWQDPSLTYTEGKTDMQEKTLNEIVNSAVAKSCNVSSGGDYYTTSTYTIAGNPNWNNVSTGTGAGNISNSGWVTSTDYYPISAATIITKDDVKKLIEEHEKEKKEKTTMNTSKMFNFDFGPVSGSQFRMSPYGLAVCTQTNGWVAYNTETKELMNVDILNFDISKMIYKMPVALSDIKEGDIVLHGGKPMFVRSLTPSGAAISVINYADATMLDILPVKSPFGFNFFTKVCTLFNFDVSAASPQNPFGSLLPFLMLGEGKEIDPMVFMLMGGNNFISNPMMMYLLMNQKDKSDMLPFLLMANGGLSNAWLAPGQVAPASSPTI